MERPLCAWHRADENPADEELRCLRDQVQAGHGPCRRYHINGKRKWLECQGRRYHQCQGAEVYFGPEVPGSVWCC